MFLQNGTDQFRFEEFRTEGGRHLAVNACERMNPGCRAVAVAFEGERFAVAGRCCRCGAVCFEDERPRRDGERVVCFAC